MKKRAIIITIVLILCLVLCRWWLTEKKINYPTYVIVTDMKYLTMQDDGGSNTSIYYEIKKDTVRKLEDKYLGFKGYEYQGKILYQKKVEDNLLEDLKKLLDEKVEKGSEEASGTLIPFTVRKDDQEIILFEEKGIEEIKGILKRIDSFHEENHE